MKNTKILAISVYGKEARNVYFLKKLGSLFAKKATETVNQTLDQGANYINDVLSGNDTPQPYENIDPKQKNFITRWARRLIRSPFKLAGDVVRGSMETVHKGVTSTYPMLEATIGVPRQFTGGAFQDTLQVGEEIVCSFDEHIRKRTIMPITTAMRGFYEDTFKRLFSESQGLGKDLGDITKGTAKHTYDTAVAVAAAPLRTALAVPRVIGDMFDTGWNYVRNIFSRVSDASVMTQQAVDDTASNIAETASAVGNVLTAPTQMLASDGTMHSRKAQRDDKRSNILIKNQEARDQRRSRFNQSDGDSSEG